MTDTGETRIVRTVCRIGDGVNCGLLAHVKDGKLIKVGPADFPKPGLKYICHKGLCSVDDLVYHPDRLKYPLKREGPRGAGQWKRISWDETFTIIAEKLKEIARKHGNESVAIVPGQTWTSAVMGIYLRLASALQAKWVGITGYGDAAGPCADLVSYGHPIGHFHTTDLENPKFCLIWGANYRETQPVLWRHIWNLKKNGAKLVVIDPRSTPTASKADEHVRIRPGTDTALALGMMKVIYDNGLIDESFVSRYTVGPFLAREDNGLFLREKDIDSVGSNQYLIWDTASEGPKVFDANGIVPALRGDFNIKGFKCKPSFQLLTELLDRYPPEVTSRITDIPSATIEKLALSYGTEKPAVIFRGLGMQRTFHGDLPWRAATALASLTGNIKLDGYRDFQLNRAEFTTVMSRVPEKMPLLELYQAIGLSSPHPVKGLLIAGTNFINQNPDFNKVLNELWPRLDFVVTVDLFMNTTAEYSDIVLPACSQYERTDLAVPFDTLNPYLQLQPEVIKPLAESKPDVDIVNGIASKMGFGDFFNHSSEAYLKMLLKSDHISLKDVTLDKLKEGPIAIPHYNVPFFNTPSGRIEFYAESMKAYDQELSFYKEPMESVNRPLSNRYPLLFISGHAKHNKSSMWVNSQKLRKLDPEPRLDINPVDAEKRGIEEGDMVKVFNDRGQVKLWARIVEGIKPGVVNINQGWWPRDYIEGTHQELTHAVINPAQAAVFEPNAALNDILVEVEKVES